VLCACDHLVQNQLKRDAEAIQKMCQELEDAKFHISDLESKVYEISHDRDDVLGKLQRTVEDYVRHGEERQVANQGWESTESMLQNKVSTLDVVLEVTKDEVS